MQQEERSALEKAPLLKDAELQQIWFWDGDFGHVLGCIEGQEDRWLVEKGVLHTESDEHSGVDNLIEGDVIYRIRVTNALGDEDPRETLFTWWTVDPAAGTATLRPF